MTTSDTFRIGKEIKFAGIRIALKRHSKGRVTESAIAIKLNRREEEDEIKHNSQTNNAARKKPEKVHTAVAKIRIRFSGETATQRRVWSGFSRATVSSTR